MAVTNLARTIMISTKRSCMYLLQWHCGQIAQTPPQKEEPREFLLHEALRHQPCFHPEDTLDHNS